MNLIAQLLSSDDIVVGLDATSKKRLFEQAGQHFEQRYGISRSTVFDALFAREKMGSTGLGLGIAIPHGRIKGLKEARGAFFRLAAPVPFDAPDNQPVNLVFVLLVPEAASEHHLQLLSELAQMFSDKNFREHLAAAADVNAVFSLFTQWPSVS
ncbi:PTS IIA-like nitrogen regulatory protein PtsN [Sulfuricystis multivorans]|uniref:PTS IIA-like nitrogen regulatory protein PtsN n=1 Tax=Sulfuricystis multivorans TaxID=2211108 RepID=UPI000F83A3A1|nr:PTS IIA-like nitrogen regulatory protein PtsN [Sulfuricystis multivorans]